MNAISSSSKPIWQQAIDARNLEAWEMRDSDRNQAAKLALETKQESISQGYQLGIVHSLTVSSFNAFRRNQFAIALSEALEALATWEPIEDKTWLPKLYNTIAITYGALGERGLAVEYLHTLLELCQHNGDRVQEAIAYHNLAHTLASRGPTDQAIHYYHRAFEVFREQGEHWGEVLALLNLAELYNTSTSHHAQALICTQKALELSKKYGGIEQGFCLKVSGDNYYNQHDYPQALTCYEQGMEYLADEPSLEVDVWLAIGECQMRLQQPTQALKALQKALDICQSTNYKNMLYVCHERLYMFYKSQQNLAKALEHFEHFHHLKEQIFNETTEQKTQSFEIVRQRIQHKSELQQHQNSELKKYITELENLHQEVKELSIRDHLTNLYNRRYLFEYLELLKNRADGMSIAIIDIDHFKRINDTFTHIAGDDVLKGIAMFLKAFSRETDIAARYGGEEFVVVFPEANLEQAFLACERLRNTIENHYWNEDYPELKVTLSIGLVSGNVKDYEKLLANADKKLYEAKAAGRNCIKWQSHENETFPELIEGESLFAMR